MRPSKSNRLHKKVAGLRAQARRNRRMMRDLRSELAVLKEKKAGSAGYDYEPEPGLPVEVRAPAEPEQPAASAAYAQRGIAALDSESVTVGMAQQDVEVLYVGDAAVESSVRPSLDRYGLRSSSTEPGRAVAARQPAPPPTVALASERLGVTQAVPKLRKSLRQAHSAQDHGVRNRKKSFDDPGAEYRRYYAALTAGNHAAAVVGFRNYVARFPRHPFADNAQYWLAEAFYDQKRFQAALVEFKKVIDNYAHGNKVPDALLKLGYCHAMLGDLAAARKALQQVIERYPASNPASLAAAKLETIGK